MSMTLRVRPLLRPWKRCLSTAAFPTWNSLLFPSAQDSHILLTQLPYNETRAPNRANTSPFTPQEWTSQRLPSCLYLSKDLPYRMHQDLRRVIDEHCPTRAHAVLQGHGRINTPTGQFLQLQYNFRQINSHNEVLLDDDIYQLIVILFSLITSTPSIIRSKSCGTTSRLQHLTGSLGNSWM
ncbi:hypothetical protein BGW80DRAFT_1308313, partial [Lactifluus volemus]